MSRRNVLQSAAALAVGKLALDGAAASAAGTAATGDFAFLAGEWRIANRMKQGESWIEFPGEATVHSLLAGNASIEELRIPARNFSGIGLRLYDAAAGVWNDHWINGQARTVGGAMAGTFENGIGTFLADDEENGRPIKARGVWDRITATRCRWHQAVSRDAGATWEMSWEMHWTRA
ncbi:MAG TPA: hypothetical protein VLK25_03120 [Allosphingosinicella sp.]|nr:hypothetical protein [Allosphingosinicella sp.]